MISAHRIIMNGLSSDEFDIVGCLSFDGDNGTSSSFFNQDGIYTEHYNGHRILHRFKNNEIFSPTITFIKTDYSEFDADDNRRILSWLTASDKPGWIEFYKDDSNVMEYQIFGGVESLELYKLANSRIIGYVVTFTSTHPYAFSRKMEITKQISGTTTFNIISNSDEYSKPIYPTVTIKFSDENIYMPIDVNPLENNYVMLPNTIYALDSDNNGEYNTYYANIPSMSYKGLIQLTEDTAMAYVEENDLYANYVMPTYFSKDKAIARAITKDNSTYVWEKVGVGAAVRIENITTGTNTTINGVANGNTVILDGMNKVISVYKEVKGALVQENTIIGDHFSWEWMPLNYGDNNISIVGNCEVVFEWLEPRKVGDM